jgi:hypothetical protein
LTRKKLLIGYCKANNEQNRKKDKAALPRTVVFKGIDLAQRWPGDYFPNSGQR